VVGGRAEQLSNQMGELLGKRGELINGAVNYENDKIINRYIVKSGFFCGRARKGGCGFREGYVKNRSVAKRRASEERG